jgi:hypothetical protein
MLDNNPSLLPISPTHCRDVDSASRLDYAPSRLLTTRPSKQQQDVVALSTTEAEYVALIRVAQSAVHFRKLPHDVHHRHRGPTTVYEDSEGVVKLANNPMASHMTKHIDICHFYTGEPVDARTIAAISIPASDMLADGLTKAFPQPKHAMLFKHSLGSNELHIRSMI